MPRAGAVPVAFALHRGASRALSHTPYYDKSIAEHTVQTKLQTKILEAGSAQGPPSATERRECKSRVTLLLRDADSGQIDHMAAEPTHGPHHPCTSSSRLGARGTLLAIANVQLPGGSRGVSVHMVCLCQRRDLVFSRSRI